MISITPFTVEITTGKADKNRRSSCMKSFALYGIEDFIYGV